MSPNVFIYISLLIIYSLAFYVASPWGEFPLNDDWVYTIAAIESSNAGALKLTGHESAWSIPNIVLGALITRVTGFSHAALRTVSIFGLATTAIVLNSYLSRYAVPSLIRFFALGTLVFNPINFILSASFMTDVLFLALWLGACFSWDMWLTGGGKKWAFLATVTSVLAVLQRQFAVIIPAVVAMLIVLDLREGHRKSATWLIPRRHSLSLALSFLVLLVALITHVWMTSNGAFQAALFSVRSPADIVLLAEASVIFLSLSILPITCLAGQRPTAASTRYGRVIIAITIGITIASLSQESFRLFGNYISRFGMFEENVVLLGQRPIIFGAASNCVTIVIGLTTLLSVVPSTYRKLFCSELIPVKASSGMSGSLILSRVGLVHEVAAGIYMLAMLVRGQFDRYLLPVIPSLLIVLVTGLPQISRRRIIAASLSLAALLGVTVTLSADYFAWNRAKWLAAEELVAQGVPAGLIHAGHEWHGWHNPGEAPFPSNDIQRYRYLITFSDTFPGFSPIRTVGWYSYWAPHERSIFVLRRNDL